MKSVTKRAEAGVGTLILFIALILVAAVAAGVLIQTASTLQSKALFTGSQAQGQVSTQAMAISLYGKDASSGNPRTVDRAFLKMKLAAGSDPMKLSDTVLQIDTSNSRYNLIFNTSVDCTVETNATNGLFNASIQGVFYGVSSQIGTTETDGYLKRGEVIELCFALPEAIGEGQDLRVRFSPKVGSATVVETKTPDTMLDERVQLFP